MGLSPDRSPEISTGEISVNRLLHAPRYSREQVLTDLSIVESLERADGVIFGVEDKIHNWRLRLEREHRLYRPR